MACTPPGTLSPGHLFLRYQYVGTPLIHTVGMHLLAGVDPNSTTLLAAVGQAWANVLGPALNNIMIITDVGVRDATGHTLWEQSLATAVTGTHASNGQDKWYSQTLDIEGTGVPGGSGFCNGKTRCRFFTGGAYRFAPGLKTYPAAADAALLALVAHLEADAYIGADYYGQKATFDGSLPVQWNARTQRKYGS